jgi:hypothetical protein
VKRREFIAGVAGAAVWPVAAGAQQSERVRRVGALMGGDENDPEARAQFSEFVKGLAELGWTDGRNLRIDIRWAANADLARACERVGRPAPRRASRTGDCADRCTPAGDENYPDRICGRL